MLSFACSLDLSRALSLARALSPSLALAFTVSLSLSSGVMFKNDVGSKCLKYKGTLTSATLYFTSGAS